MPSLDLLAVQSAQPFFGHLSLALGRNPSSLEIRPSVAKRAAAIPDKTKTESFESARERIECPTTSLLTAEKQ